MRVRVLTALLLLTLWSSSIMAKDSSGEMPVIAFLGVPEHCTSNESFRTFSECGFTVSLNSYSSLSALVSACKSAKQWSVRILGRCPEMTRSPHQTARALKAETGFFGYYLQDEPNALEISQRQIEMSQLKAIDIEHPFYINLFPCYNPDWVKSTMKTEDYSEYLHVASKTLCQQLSFDYYPVTTKGIRSNWYYNLEMVRQESLSSGKPFWGFVLSTPHDVPFDEGNYYPTPTLASLRLQVYSNLAYGAQAIQYFTYWTPGNEEGFNYHDAPISRDGKKTKTYDVVQQMNRELKVISKLFYGAKVLSVHHLGAIPEGTTRQTTMPLNIRLLKIVGRQGAVVSQFQQNGHRYLAVVNKSHEEPLTLRIRPRNNTPRHITKQLQEEAMKPSYTLSPGDIALFRLR